MLALHAKTNERWEKVAALQRPLAMDGKIDVFEQQACKIVPMKWEHQPPGDERTRAYNE